jgi:MarR family transcriptional regulator, lower aerobic nicotinate degradation pathway regulator
MKNLHSEPGYLFRRMQQIAAAIFWEECAPFDLTCLQYSALARIRDRPGIDVTRLSEIMDFDRSTLGGVMERLELKGYIRRRATVEDKRIKLLEVTKQGRALLDEIAPHVERAQRRILDGLSSEDQRALLRLLTRLVEFNAERGRTASNRSEQEKRPIMLALRRASGSATTARSRPRKYNPMSSRSHRH